MALYTGKIVNYNWKGLKFPALISKIWTPGSATTALSLHLLNFNTTEINYQFVDQVPSGTADNTWELHPNDPDLQLASSKFRTSKNTAQTVALGINTKITYQDKPVDSRNEFNLTNSRFIASEDGVYFFSGAITFVAAASTRVILMLYVNNAEYVRLSDNLTGTSNAITIPFSCHTSLKLNDYAEIFINVGKIATISSGSTLTYLGGNKIS